MLGYTPFPKKIKYMTNRFNSAHGLYLCVYTIFYITESCLLLRLTAGALLIRTHQVQDDIYDT